MKDLRKLYKLLFVIVLNMTLCSLDFNISAVRTTASDKGQEQKYNVARQYNVHD